MWPVEVERVAILLRAAGVEGRLEELPAGETEAPGPALRAEAYDCGGRSVVALIPADRVVDRGKLSMAARCASAGPIPAPSFPYADSVVLVDRLVFAEQVVWIEAGSERHVVALAPAHIVELTRAQTADLVADARNGGG
jgi:hypothetical protein